MQKNIILLGGINKVYTDSFAFTHLPGQFFGDIQWLYPAPELIPEKTFYVFFQAASRPEKKPI